jgi:tetratricopeptide (TPR) repeat protein
VRITAQLIRADSGAHLWTENYDRELTDIFAIQEDIAQAIAVALRVPLGLQQGNRLVTSRTGNAETYEQYLRARTLYRSREITRAIGVLESVVERDPDYAPAWALLGASYLLAPVYDTSTGANGVLERVAPLYRTATVKAEAAAREALRRDPRNALAHAALADVAFWNGKWAETHSLYDRALELDPNDPDVLLRSALRMVSLGRFKDALARAQKVHSLEPFVPTYNVFIGVIMFMNGQRPEGIALIEAAPANSALNFYRNYYLALLYAEERRYGDAADVLLAISPQQNLVSHATVLQAVRVLRSLAQRARPALPETMDGMTWVYTYAGEPERILDYYDRALAQRHFAGMQIPFLPSQASLRQADRFKKLVRDLGVDYYWRARGWADLCRPIGADDFECD